MKCQINKVFALLLAVVFIIGVVSGCGDGSSETIHTSSFSFTMPSEWRGKVTTEQQGESIYLYYNNILFATITSEPASVPLTAGDVANSMIWHEESQDIRVKIIIRNMAFLLPTVENDGFGAEDLLALDEKEKSDLINFVTGGRATLQECREAVGTYVPGVTDSMSSFMMEVLPGTLQLGR